MAHFIKMLFFGGFLILSTVTTFIGARDTDTLNDEEKNLATQSFQYVWETIYEKHFDPTFGGLDWPAVYDRFYPEIVQSESKQEITHILNRMIDTLGLSHFLLIPAAFYEEPEQNACREFYRGTLGCETRVLDSRAYIVRLLHGYPAETASIPYGSQIISINHKILQEELERLGKELEFQRYGELILSNWVNRHLTGRVGDSVSVVYRTNQRDTCKVWLVFAEPANDLFQVGFFPPMPVWIATDTLRSGIGYIAFNAFMDPVNIMPVFNDALSKFMKRPGIIIDLRGNPGGLLNMVQGMGGWFIEEKGKSFGSMCFRDMSLKIMVSPRPATFRAKLAILIDGYSACAAEIMAAGLQDNGRARVFGTRSAGAVLGSTVEKLPNGDGFQYASACYRTIEGEMLEGGGVEPDVVVPLTVQLLKQGKDPVIEAAIQWIEEGDYRDEK